MTGDPLGSGLAGGLLVCGTASDAGKTTLVTGLCRLLARRGVKVAPFKAQNMSLNSAVTPSGHEIGRAQAAQAQAAGVEAEVAMNPVLLKPTSERRSQVIVEGRPWAVLDAAEYQRRKPELLELVLANLADLRSRFDVVVCEGAGSPAEINLLDGDIVNLGLARRAGLPAVLVGDIDRGGVFAALYGTVALLPPDLRELVGGFVINKLRGDPALLGDGTAQLQARTGVPTLGVIPWAPGLGLDAEDSLSLERSLESATLAPASEGSPPDPASEGSPPGPASEGSPPAPAFEGSPPDPASETSRQPGPPLDVAVIRLPRVSNFTDLEPLAAEPGVALRWVTSPRSLGRPDLVVLPGSKATVSDLAWLRHGGLAAAITELARSGAATVVGICGGYQMLGRAIADPDGVESGPATTVAGLGLLDVATTFGPDKVLRQRRGSAWGEAVAGYQIHHGRTERISDESTSNESTSNVPTRGAPWFALDRDHDGDNGEGEAEGATSPDGGVCGTSLHGLWEADGFRAAFLGRVAARAGAAWRPSSASFAQLREQRFDRIADLVEQHLDLGALGALIRRGRSS